jgi:hypothetical protein
MSRAQSSLVGQLRTGIVLPTFDERAARLCGELRRAIAGRGLRLTDMEQHLRLRERGIPGDEMKALYALRYGKQDQGSLIWYLIKDAIEPAINTIELGDVNDVPRVYRTLLGITGNHTHIEPRLREVADLVAGIGSYHTYRQGPLRSHLHVLATRLIALSDQAESRAAAGRLPSARNPLIVVGDQGDVLQPLIGRPARVQHRNPAGAYQRTSPG